MLALTPPEEPPEFRRSTSRARQKIEAIIEQGRNPKSEDFSKVWKDYKHLFSAAQHGKCGYCEHDTHVGYHGDVEHYAPKSEIECISGTCGPRMLGQQTPAHPTTKTHDRGYYWLAFEWNNYVYACAICNQTHKRALFPVAENGDQQPGFPRPGMGYEPLLLNPYEPELQPSEHFDFDEFGFIFDHGGSVRGWETIRSCRLDRIELQEARREKAGEVTRYLNLLEHGAYDDNRGRIRRALIEIMRLGDATTPFAGMARIMTEHRLEQSWSDLSALCEKLISAKAAG